MGLGYRPRGLAPRQRTQRARVATLARVGLLGALTVACVCGSFGVWLLREAAGQPAAEAHHGFGRTLLTVGSTFHWAPASMFPAFEASGDPDPACAKDSNKLPNGTSYENVTCDSFDSYADKCSFVSCADECQPEGGFINYIVFPYCTVNSSVVGLAIFAGWVVFLFIALGSAAEEFFCPALSVISDTLSLSHNVAGVTFLAFGNGAPDIFSVYASIKQGGEGTKLAVGELYGAGVFVTTAVVGSVAIAVPFTLTRRPFIRDVVCYLTAAVWLYIVLWDGDITLYESIGFIAVYVGYVAVVIIGRKIYQSRKKRNAESPVARKHRISKTEEMLPAPPRMQIQEPSIAAALGATENFAVASSAALGPDLGSNKFGDKINESRKHAKGDKSAPGFSIYEDDENDFDDDVPLLNDDSDAEMLDEGQPVIAGGRSTMLEEKKDPLAELLTALIPLDVEEFKETAWYWKAYAIFAAPIVFFMTITIPVVDLEENDQNWRQYVTVLQCIVSPVFVVIGAGFGGDAGMLGGVYPAWALALCLGILLATFVLATTVAQKAPKWHAALGFAGFVVAVVWIYSVANEIVNVLQVIGDMLGINRAILGITVLAWGNSIGDFVSNYTVAKQGFPQMAVGACFGGPALNVLLGIGISCTLMCLTVQNPYPIGKDLNLKISGAFLLFSLLTSLIVVPLSNFSVGKKYGLFLIGVYVVYVAVSLYVEISGIGA